MSPAIEVATMNRRKMGPGRVFPRSGGSAFWAGIACFCLFSAGLAWGEDMPPAEEAYVPMEEEELADLTSAPSPEERAALLASDDADALQAALDEANRRTDRLAEAIPALHRDIRTLRAQAMSDSDKAREIRAEIQRLEDELAAYADDLPEIRKRLDALEVIRSNMMDELRFRRELTRKLGRDLSRAVPAQQPILEP